MTFCPTGFSPNIFYDGVTGYFVVLRRSAFVAHAFSEIGFAGASGAILLGIEPIAGLLAGSLLGGLTIAALGRRATNRDTQIGIVLAFTLGLGLLFISLYKSFATAAISILFGEILGISTSDVDLTLVAGAGILIAVGFLYMLVVAVAVSFAVQVTGVLLIFSLMVTPAATAQYLSRRPGTAIALSVGIALMATWAGLFVGFYTIYPVSFFITAIAFSLYILVRLARYGIRPKMATQVSKRK